MHVHMPCIQIIHHQKRQFIKKKKKDNSLAVITYYKFYSTQFNVKLLRNWNIGMWWVKGFAFNIKLIY